MSLYLCPDHGLTGPMACCAKAEWATVNNPAANPPISTNIAHCGADSRDPAMNVLHAEIVDWQRAAVEVLNNFEQGLAN